MTREDLRAIVALTRQMRVVGNQSSAELYLCPHPEGIQACSPGSQRQLRTRGDKELRRADPGGIAAPFSFEIPWIGFNIGQAEHFQQLLA
jgi:hypothetical protein